MIPCDVYVCVGVWDVMTNEEVLDFIRKRIAQMMKPDEVCHHSLDCPSIAPSCSSRFVNVCWITALPLIVVWEVWAVTT